MNVIKWIVMALALLQGSWLIFDGGRALISGDYVTPRSGPHAGELGPWSRIVSAVGFNPRSTFIKTLHVFLGIAWLTALVVFRLHPATGWWALLGCALASLWYMPVGTLTGVIVIVLLLTPQARNPESHAATRIEADSIVKSTRLS